jgi:hypothetical protein
MTATEGRPPGRNENAMSRISRFRKPIALFIAAYLVSSAALGETSRLSSRVVFSPPSLSKALGTLWMELTGTGVECPKTVGKDGGKLVRLGEEKPPTPNLGPELDPLGLCGR